MKTWQKSIIEFFVIMGSILAAFWLEEYRDDKEKEEKIAKTLFSIKTELLDNYNYLQVMHENLTEFNQWYEFFKTHKYDTSVFLVEGVFMEGAFSAKQIELDSLKNINDRFNDAKFIRKLNSTENIYGTPINIDMLPEEIITDSWEATKSSGMLIELDHELVVKLTNAYRILHKDFGYNVDEFDKGALVKGFSDMNIILTGYHNFEIIYEYQVGSLNPLIPEIVELIDEHLKL